MPKANDTMFASAAQSSARRQLGAYQLVQVASIVDDASPHRLVSMLFDGLIDSLAQARGAIRAGNIEEKGRAITRAVRIVEEGLKAGLNLKEGGKLATDLRDLYAYVNYRLTQANLRNDEAAIEECRSLIEPLRSAWAEVANKVKA